MKRPSLFSLITIIIFTSIIFISCSTEIGQNDGTQNLVSLTPVSTHTLTPAATPTLPETRLPRCYNPHPTRSMMFVDYPVRTEDLTAEISVRSGHRSTVTIKGPLGVYTATNGLIQVELVAETRNAFEISATFPASVLENRCIWQGEALSQKIAIVHSYENDAAEPTHTPTPD